MVSFGGCSVNCREHIGPIPEVICQSPGSASVKHFTIAEFFTYPAKTPMSFKAPVSLRILAEPWIRLKNMVKIYLVLTLAARRAEPKPGQNHGRQQRDVAACGALEFLEDARPETSIRAA